MEVNSLLMLIYEHVLYRNGLQYSARGITIVGDCYSNIPSLVAEKFIFCSTFDDILLIIGMIDVGCNYQPHPHTGFPW